MVEEFLFIAWVQARVISISNNYSES